MPVLTKVTALSMLLGVAVSTMPAHAFLSSGPVWRDDELPVPYFINEAGSDDLTFVQVESLFQASFESWTEVPCSSFDVAYQGTTTKGAEVDDQFTMVFVEEGWGLGPQVLGATLRNTASTDPLRFHVDIAFNGEHITWKIGGGGGDLTVLDPQSVMTHEIGHFLGLAHTLDDGSATMAAAYLPDLSQRSLSHDDKWGICTLYPKADSTGECDPSSDTCREGSSCQQLGEWFFCVEERDGLEAPCSHDSINCQETCVYTSADLSRGFCSKVCLEDADCEPEGTCEPFGETKVCRLKGSEPEEADAEAEDVVVTVDATGDDTKTGFDLGIITGEDVEADADVMVPEGDGEPDGCGCRVRASSGGSSGVGWALALVGLVGLRRRPRRP